MRSHVRLFAWYRTLPLFAVLLVGAISFLYSYAPPMLFQMLYPLKYEDRIKEASQTYGIDPYLVAAVIKTESNWDPEASSHKGAQGLMQLMPETANDIIAQGLIDGNTYSADNLTDPDTNIEFGCAYLAYLIRYFNGATDKAIAAYNAGMGNVEDWTKEGDALHNAITFPETQAYLARVNMAQQRYRELYPEAFL